MISKPASNEGFNQTGTFVALLEAVEAYAEGSYKNPDDKELNLTFVLNLGDVEGKGKDVIFKQGFVRVPLDNDGIPKMGNDQSKYYMMVSGFYGDKFDPKSEKHLAELGLPEEYDSPETLLALPSYEDFKQGGVLESEDRIKLNFLKIGGKDIIGEECNIELGYASKPDGTKSTKVSVINAMPIVKQVRRASGSKLPAGAPA